MDALLVFVKPRHVAIIIEICECILLPKIYVYDVGKKCL